MTNLLMAYGASSVASITSGIGLNALLKGSFMGRLSPLIAVILADCISIPIMNKSELSNGKALEYENGDQVHSTSIIAAKAELEMSVLSRICMLLPAFGIPV